MKDTIYLVVNKNGVRSFRKTVPNLDGNEISVKLEVEVDNSWFVNNHPVVHLKLDEKHKMVPEVKINADVEGFEFVQIKD